MDVAFNPKDQNTFATASLDRTIKIWNLSSPKANYTLEGHEKGINTISYYPGADKPYLVSGADDFTVRIWDYQNKACVRVLDGHNLNVSSVLFHPELPLILSGSEDCTMKVWSANTFRLEVSFTMNLDRIWSISHSYAPGSTELAIGCDEGAMVLQLGKCEPTSSMDLNGKVIWAKHHEVLTANLKTIPDLTQYQEGDRLIVASKELGQCEIFPQTLEHSPNGRFVVVCGDGEYIIYTALAWRNRSFGKGLDFSWSATSNEYAVKDSNNRVVLYSNFNESGSIKLPQGSFDKLFGGHLLGAACSGSQLCLYDWASGVLIRRIDVEANGVYWNEAGNKIVISTPDCAYVLKYDAEIVQAYAASGRPIPEDGIEEAFEVIDEITERVISGIWVDSCFVYVNGNNRIAYHVGGESSQIAIHDKPVFLLGYLRDENRLVLTDKDANNYTYSLALSVIEYQTAILNGDLNGADRILPAIPKDQHNRVARFLEAQKLPEKALELANDPDYRFDLAIGLGRLDVAYEIVQTSSGTEHKWRLLGDRALADWKLGLAESCFWNGKDLTSLLLLYSAAGNESGLLKLAEAAIENDQSNIAFTCFFTTGRKNECFDLLMKSESFSEAALFARTHLGNEEIEKAAVAWKLQLSRQSLTSTTPHVDKQASDYILLPSSAPEQFDSVSEKHPQQQQQPIVVPATVPLFTGESRPRAVSFDKSVDDPFIPGSYHSGGLSGTNSLCDGASDHMSLEVNTTGTGSLRNDGLDDLRTTGATDLIDRLTIHDELPEDLDEPPSGNIENPEPNPGTDSFYNLQPANESLPEKDLMYSEEAIGDEAAEVAENAGEDGEVKPSKPSSPLQNLNFENKDDDWL